MLYIVATPIGNLNDMTFRGIQILKEVDFIACEDTRHSLKLLNHFEIKKPLVSYHKFNEKESAQRLIKEILDGKTCALISDAGTPLISDPGHVLIKTAYENGIKVTVIPGACAFVPALVLSSFDTSKFCFLGFMPEKRKDKDDFFKPYENLDSTLIIYSAPHDVARDLEYLRSFLGNRRVAIVKELTKIHETVEIFNLGDEIKTTLQGEFVLLIEGQKQKLDMFKSLTVDEHIEYYISQGNSKMDAIKKTAKDRNVRKNEIYNSIL